MEKILMKLFNQFVFIFICLICFSFPVFSMSNFNHLPNTHNGPKGEILNFLPLRDVFTLQRCSRNYQKVTQDYLTLPNEQEFSFDVHNLEELDHKRLMFVHLAGIESLKIHCVNPIHINRVQMQTLVQSFPSFTNLKKLALTNCQIGDGGAQALAERLPQSLTYLDLRYNPIRAVTRQSIRERFPFVIFCSPSTFLF